MGKTVCDLGEDDESEQLRSLTEKVLETEYRLENKIEEIENNVQDQVLESEQRLGQKITQLNRETKDLIRRRSQMVLALCHKSDFNPSWMVKVVSWLNLFYVTLMCTSRQELEFFIEVFF